MIRFCVYTFIIIASSFLTDESGFLHPASSSSWGDSGIDGGFDGGGDCGGGEITEPRRVESLPVIDDEGKEQEWNLINRFKTSTLPLPENVNGEACNTYLQRKPSWVSLKTMMKETQGMNIVSYSFRHSYSLRAHVLGIDAGSVSMSMGNTLEAHHRAYPYASKQVLQTHLKSERKSRCSVIAPMSYW